MPVTAGIMPNAGLRGGIGEHGIGPANRENDASPENKYVGFIKRAVLSVVSLPTKGINWAAGILGGKVLYDFAYKRALKKPLAVTVGKFWTHEWNIGGEQLSLRELAARLEEKILGFRTGAIQEQQIKDAMVGGVRWALMLDIIPSLLSQLPFLQKTILSPYKIYRILRSSNMLLSTMPEFTSALNDVKTVLTELGPKLIKGEALSDEEKLLARNVLTMLVSGPLFYFAEMGWSEHMSSDILRRINLVLMSDIGLFAFVGEAQKAIAQLPEDQRRETSTFQFLEAVEKGITFAFAGSSGAGLYQIVNSVVVDNKMDPSLVKGGDDVRTGAMPGVDTRMEGSLVDSKTLIGNPDSQAYMPPPGGSKALYSHVPSTDKSSKDIIATDNPELGVSDKDIINGVYVKDKSVENVDGTDVLHLAVDDPHSAALLTDRVIDRLIERYVIDGSRLDSRSVRALEKYFDEISKEILEDLASRNKHFATVKVDDLIKGVFEIRALISGKDYGSLDDIIKVFSTKITTDNQLYVLRYKQDGDFKIVVGSYERILHTLSTLKQLGLRESDDITVVGISSNYDKMQANEKDIFINSILADAEKPESTKPAIEPPPIKGKQIFFYSDKDTGSKTTIFTVDKGVFLKAKLINKPFLSVASDAIYSYLEDVVLQSAATPGSVAIPSKLDIQHALYVSLLDNGGFLFNKDKTRHITLEEFSRLHNGDVVEMSLMNVQIRYTDLDGNVRVVNFPELIKDPAKALGFTPNAFVASQNVGSYQKTTLPRFNKHLKDFSNAKMQVFIKTLDGRLSYDGQKFFLGEKDINNPVYREVILIAALEAVKSNPSLLQESFKGQNFGLWLSDRKLFGLNKTQASELQNFLVGKSILDKTLINKFYGDHGVLLLVEYMDKFGLLKQPDSRDFPAITKLLGWKEIIDTRMATVGNLLLVKLHLADGREIIFTSEGANLSSDLGKKEINGQLFTILDDVVKDTALQLQPYSYVRSILRSDNPNDILYFLQHEIGLSSSLGIDFKDVEILNSAWDYKHDSAFITIVNKGSDQPITIRVTLGQSDGQIEITKLSTALSFNSTKTVDVLNSSISAYVHSPVIKGSFSDADTRRTLITSLILNRGISPDVFGHVVFVGENNQVYVEQMGNGSQSLLYLDSNWLRNPKNRDIWITMVRDMNKHMLTTSEIVNILSSARKHASSVTLTINNSGKIGNLAEMVSLLKELHFPPSFKQRDLIVKPDGLYINYKGQEFPIYIQNHKLLSLMPGKSSMHMNYTYLEWFKQQFPEVKDLAIIPLKDDSIWAIVDKSKVGTTHLIETHLGVNYDDSQKVLDNEVLTVKETIGGSNYDLPGLIAINSLTAFDVTNSPKLLTNRGILPFSKSFRDLALVSKFFPIHKVGGKTFVSIFDGSYVVLDRETGEIIKYNKPVSAADLQKALQLSLQYTGVSKESLLYRASVDTSGDSLVRAYILLDAYKQLSRILLSNSSYVHLDLHSERGTLHIFNKEGVEIDVFHLPDKLPLFTRVNGEWREVLQNSEGKYFLIGRDGLKPVSKDSVLPLDKIGKIVTDLSGNPYIYKGRFVIQAADGNLYSIDNAKLVSILPTSVTKIFLGQKCCKNIEKFKIKIDKTNLVARYEKAIDLQTTINNLDFRFKEFLANNKANNLIFTGGYPDLRMDLIADDGYIIKNLTFSGFVTKDNIPVWKSIDRHGATIFVVLQKDRQTGQFSAQQITNAADLHKFKIEYIDSFTGLPVINTTKGVAVITPTNVLYRGSDFEQQLKLKYIQTADDVNQHDVGYGVAKFTFRNLGSWLRTAPNRIIKVMLDEVSSSFAGFLAKTIDRDAEHIADLIAQDARESALIAYSTGVSERFIEQLIVQEDHKIFTRGGGTESGYNLEFKTLAAMLASRGQRGGSTVYQLLAKTYMYDIQRLRGQGFMNSLERKSLELAVANKLSKQLTPQEAIYALASRISFGDIAGVSLKGVDIASLVFFGHGPRDLTVGESAILTSSVNLPYKYGPLSFFNRGSNADPSDAISMAVGDLEKLYILGLVDKATLIDGIREVSDYYDGSPKELQDFIKYISYNHKLDSSLRFNIDIKTEYTKYVESLILESQTLPIRNASMSDFKRFSTVSFLDYLRDQGKLTEAQVEYIRRYIANKRRNQALSQLSNIISSDFKTQRSPFLGILNKDIFSTLNAMLILRPYDTDLKEVVAKILQAKDVLTTPRIKELIQSNANFTVLLEYLQTKGIITKEEVQQISDVWHYMVGSNIMEFADGNTIRVSPYIIDVEIDSGNMEANSNEWIISKTGFYYNPSITEIYGKQGDIILRQNTDGTTSINIDTRSLEIPAGYLAMKISSTKGQTETILVKPVDINSEHFYREVDSNRIFTKGDDGLKFAGILVEDSNHNSYIIYRKNLQFDPVSERDSIYKQTKFLQEVDKVHDYNTLLTQKVSFNRVINIDELNNCKGCILLGKSFISITNGKNADRAQVQINSSDAYVLVDIKDVPLATKNSSTQKVFILMPVNGLDKGKIIALTQNDFERKFLIPGVGYTEVKSIKQSSVTLTQSVQVFKDIIAHKLYDRYGYEAFEMYPDLYTIKKPIQDVIQDSLQSHPNLYMAVSVASKDGSYLVGVTPNQEALLPGSIMKTITAYLAVKYGIRLPNWSGDYIKLWGVPIQNWTVTSDIHNSVISNPHMTIPEVLAYSNNVGAASLMYQILYKLEHEQGLTPAQAVKQIENDIKELGILENFDGINGFSLQSDGTLASVLYGAFGQGSVRLTPEALAQFHSWLVQVAIVGGPAKYMSFVPNENSLEKQIDEEAARVVLKGMQMAVDNRYGTTHGIYAPLKEDLNKILSQANSPYEVEQIYGKTATGEIGGDKLNYGASTIIQFRDKRTGEVIALVLETYLKGEDPVSAHHYNPTLELTADMIKDLVRKDPSLSWLYIYNQNKELSPIDEVHAMTSDSDQNQGSEINSKPVYDNQPRVISINITKGIPDLLGNDSALQRIPQSRRDQCVAGVMLAPKIKFASLVRNAPELQSYLDSNKIEFDLNKTLAELSLNPARFSDIELIQNSSGVGEAGGVPYVLAGVVKYGDPDNNLKKLEAFKALQKYEGQQVSRYGLVMASDKYYTDSSHYNELLKVLFSGTPILLYRPVSPLIGDYDGHVASMTMIQDNDGRPYIALLGQNGFNQGKIQFKIIPYAGLTQEKLLQEVRDFIYPSGAALGFVPGKSVWFVYKYHEGDLQASIPDASKIPFGNDSNQNIDNNKDNVQNSELDHTQESQSAEPTKGLPEYTFFDEGNPNKENADNMQTVDFNTLPTFGGEMVGHGIEPEVNRQEMAATNNILPRADGYTPHIPISERIRDSHDAILANGYSNVMDSVSSASSTQSNIGSKLDSSKTDVSPDSIDNNSVVDEAISGVREFMEKAGDTVKEQSIHAAKEILITITKPALEALIDKINKDSPEVKIDYEKDWNLKDRPFNVAFVILDYEQGADGSVNPHFSIDNKPGLFDIPIDSSRISGDMLGGLPYSKPLVGHADFTGMITVGADTSNFTTVNRDLHTKNGIFDTVTWPWANNGKIGLQQIRDILASKSGQRPDVVFVFSYQGLRDITKDLFAPWEYKLDSKGKPVIQLNKKDFPNTSKYLEETRDEILSQYPYASVQQKQTVEKELNRLFTDELTLDQFILYLRSFRRHGLGAITTRREGLAKALMKDLLRYYLKHPDKLYEVVNNIINHNILNEESDVQVYSFKDGKAVPRVLTLPDLGSLFGNLLDYLSQ